MPIVASLAGKAAYGRPQRAALAAPASLGGSMSFSGTSTSNLSIPNDVDFRMGTGDFTIEWFQYMLSTNNSAPRIFSIGTYSTASIAVSIEGSAASRTFYAWISGANSIESGQNYNNQWIHFAITRSGTSLRIFKNGTQIGTTLTNSTNFNDTTHALRIGNETSTSTIAAFNGYITNFRWVKGTALYTSNFARPSTPLTSVPGTILLLLSTNSGTVTADSSGFGKTVSNNNVTWNSASPF